MLFPNFFADAESDFSNAEFVIYGVPYDKTSSFRAGVDKAPDRIREASWNFESYNIRTGVNIKDIKIHDYGNLDVSDDSPKTMVKKVRDLTKKLLKNNKFPIAIGGEHSITVGIISAFPKDIFVLSLDAHIDFREDYKNERYNHACVIKRISDYLNIENIMVFGIRSAEKVEYDQANNKNLFFIDTYEINDYGIEKSIEKLYKKIGKNKIYLTLDVDVIDPGFAPGTSTPEPFGITPFDIIKIIDRFSSQIIGFDIVEVCPPYDNGETSILAARIIRYIIEKTWIMK